MIKNPSNGNGQNKPKPPTPPKRSSSLPRALAPRNQQRRMPAARNKQENILGEVAAAYASGQRSSAPRITATRDQSRIVHRELVSSVVGSNLFTVLATYALNPGISALFNWLSTQAVGWEKYRFNRLCFKYFTRTGSGTPGSVMLAPDYDPADEPPASEVIASAFQSVAEDAPWKNITCELDVKRFGGEKFIRTGPLAPNLDIKTYDSGQMFLCTVDGTDIPWGKLWVEYDVTLLAPALPASGGALLSSWVGSTSSANIDFPFANMFVASGSDTGSYTVTNGGSILFNKAGRFMVNVSFTTLEEVSSVGIPDPVTTLGLLLSTDGVGGGLDASRFVMFQSYGPGAALLYEPTFSGTPTVIGLVAVAQVPTVQAPPVVAP